MPWIALRFDFNVAAVAKRRKSTLWRAQLPTALNGSFRAINDNDKHKQQPGWRLRYNP
ncbi:hypothetical protein GCM10023156_35910 [Novipirellula rosea]|uniref:Uncharacterized protein n=1 Tax=Novipirellula rosea TaxID=1031540 RepID=A0ABP8MY95_9BACT